MLIPEERQQDVIDVFWVLLMNAHGRCNPEQDAVLKLDVEGGFRLMRELGVTTAFPRWVKEADTEG